jgi:hypothetical protein
MLLADRGRPCRLLTDVGELMKDQTLPVSRLRAVPPRTEEDVAPDRVGERPGTLDRSAGLGVGMDTDIGEAVTQLPLGARSCRGVEAGVSTRPPIPASPSGVRTERSRGPIGDRVRLAFVALRLAGLSRRRLLAAIVGACRHRVSRLARAAPTERRTA